MTPQIISIVIAIIAAGPIYYGARRQWNLRSENPTENGTDWVVSHYERIAKDAAKRADEAERIADLYRDTFGPLPLAPPADPVDS